jgi:hypothetical protein
MKSPHFPQMFHGIVDDTDGRDRSVRSTLPRKFVTQLHEIAIGKELRKFLIHIGRNSLCRQFVQFLP